MGKDFLTPSMISYHKNRLVPYGRKLNGSSVKLSRYYRDRIFNQDEKQMMKEFRLEKIINDPEGYIKSCDQETAFRNSWNQILVKTKNLKSYEYKSVSIY